MSDIGLTGNVADNAASDSGTTDTGSFFSQPEPQSQPQAPESNGNPAWKPFLDVLPSSLHPTVMPVLQQWDKGVQEKFQQQAQLQQQFEPWQPLVEQGIDPQTIVGLLNLLNNDPRALYDNLGQYHGFTADQGQQQGSEFNLDEIQDPEQSYDLAQNPEFQQVKLQNEQLQRAFEAQMEQQQQAQVMSQLEQEINAVKEKNPNIVEPVLLSLMHTFGLSAEDAAAKYGEIQQQMLQSVQRPPAPTVLSPSGGVPAAQGLKPSEMSRGDKRNLVAEVLRNAAASQT